MCLLLSQPLDNVSQAILEDAKSLKHHILVCTRAYDLFRFICTLRSSHLSQVEVRDIVILCPTYPTEEEFKRLRMFPKLFFIIGDPQYRMDLERAGIVGADKVVIVNMYRRVDGAFDYSGPADDFADSSAM